MTTIESTPTPSNEGHGPEKKPEQPSLDAWLKRQEEMDPRPSASDADDDLDARRLNDPNALSHFPCTPFRLSTLSENVVRYLDASADELSALTKAERAVVSTFRESPLLGTLLATAINDLYEAYVRDGVIRSEEDIQLLGALSHTPFYRMRLRMTRDPENRWVRRLEPTRTQRESKYA